MNWEDAKRIIFNEIQPGHRGILKCRGNERRPIISNDGHKIVMRTGIRTSNTHSITYSMIRNAFETLIKSGIFSSADFRKDFRKELEIATCRYSMTGGVLVELGIAKKIPKGNSCSYVFREEQ